MRRLACALVFVLACGPQGGGAETGTCTPGEEGCPCEDDGACKVGLQCYSDLCVDPGSTSTESVTITVTGASASSSAGTDATVSTSTESGSTTSMDQTGPVDTSTGNDDTGTVGSETSTTGACDGPDADGDDVCDELDNCPMNENSDQADGDARLTDYDADAYFDFPLYCPGDCHALLHGDDGPWAITYTLELGGAAPTGARLRLFAALDDNSGAKPYCITIELNSTIIAGGVYLDGVQHGAPYNNEFTNFTVWEYELSAAELPLLIDGDNEIIMTLGCAAPSDWIVLEYSALEADVAAPDGIGDICDVCPETYDPEQPDIEGDNIGDVCDPDPNHP